MAVWNDFREHVLCNKEEEKRPCCDIDGGLKQLGDHLGPYARCRYRPHAPLVGLELDQLRLLQGLGFRGVGLGFRV